MHWLIIDYSKFRSTFLFQLADKEMAFAFHETSAKTGQNVFDAFRKLAYHVTEICNPNVVRIFILFT